MIAKLQVSKITLGSYVSKKGVTYPTLDIVCMDLGEGRRLGHAVIFSPDKSQKDAFEGLDLRDKVIEVDVENISVNFAGAVVFRGFADLSALPAANTKLNVVKPGASAPAAKTA